MTARNLANPAIAAALKTTAAVAAREINQDQTLAVGKADERVRQEKVMTFTESRLPGAVAAVQEMGQGALAHTGLGGASATIANVGNSPFILRDWLFGSAQMQMEAAQQMRLAVDEMRSAFGGAGRAAVQNDALRPLQ
jgi:hypothetical protein